MGDVRLASDHAITAATEDRKPHRITEEGLRQHSDVEQDHEIHGVPAPIKFIGSAHGEAQGEDAACDHHSQPPGGHRSGQEVEPAVQDRTGGDEQPDVFTQGEDEDDGKPANHPCDGLELGGGSGHAKVDRSEGRDDR